MHRFHSTLQVLTTTFVLAGCPMDDDEDDDTGAAEEEDDGASDEASSSPSTTAATSTTGDDDETTGDDESTTGAPAGSVSGIVRRTSALGPEDDGIGVLYVGAFAECDHMGQIVGFFAMPNADLSLEENEVPFAIENLALDTVYLASFLDDDGNADQAMPLPDAGDPVLADDVEDGLLTCVEVQVARGSDVVIELSELED